MQIFERITTFSSLNKFKEEELINYNSGGRYNKCNKKDAKDFYILHSDIIDDLKNKSFIEGLKVFYDYIEKNKPKHFLVICDYPTITKHLYIYCFY